MVGRLAAVFALVAAVGVAAGPAPADPGDPCPADLPPDRFLEGPAELPIGYRTGVGFDDRWNGGRIDEFDPEPTRVRVEAMPGGRYARPTDRSVRGLEHVFAAPVKFSPGDTGARVTVTYTQEYQPGPYEFETCTRTLVHDVRVADAGDVRISRVRGRVAGRRSVLVTARMSRHARRPALVLVRGTNTGRSFFESVVRRRQRDGRLRFRFRPRLSGTRPKRVTGVTVFYPGDFADPAPLFDRT